MRLAAIQTDWNMVFYLGLANATVKIVSLTHEINMAIHFSRHEIN